MVRLGLCGVGEGRRSRREEGSGQGQEEVNQFLNSIYYLSE